MTGVGINDNKMEKISEYIELNNICFNHAGHNIYHNSMLRHFLIVNCQFGIACPCESRGRY
jgi:hypothetical protein